LSRGSSRETQRSKAVATLGDVSVNVGDVPTHVRWSGNTSFPIVFVHGGVPGVSPYCGGAHIWGQCLGRIADRRSALALDLPGSGDTGVSSSPLTVPAIVEHLRGTLEALSIRQCHLVGHDLGGLIALTLAHKVPDTVRAVSVIASVSVAPSGDSMENLTFAYPPLPRWSSRSQRWALERVSYTRHHIDETLIEACVAAATKPAHLEAVARMAQGGYATTFAPSAQQAKLRIYEICREAGIPAPVQVIWGTHDPLGTVDQGMWLYRLIAGSQPACQFHLINRVGALPFREDPDTFCDLLLAFHNMMAEG
jgi:pimeloyl-ACP methyl ester carboxylesterase